MGTINSKWLDEYYDARPQLERPPRTVLGYLVGDKIKPGLTSQFSATPKKRAG